MPTFRRFSLIAAIACVVFSSTSLFAGVILPDTPGLTYRIAFVTSVGRNATSSNIADYNTFVRDVFYAANPPAAPGTDPRLVELTWTAIASTVTVNAITNTYTYTSETNTSYPIYNANKEVVAPGYSDLWDGSQPSSPINYDESGSPVAKVGVWTGTNATGGAYSPLGTAMPTYGQTNSMDFWISVGRNYYIGNSSELRLYGLSSPITNPAPEPATLSLLVTGLLGLGGVVYWRRRGSRNGVATTACSTVA